MDMIDERPDVKATKEAVKVATQAIVVAQSGFWPEITLENSNYVKREGFQSGIDWDVLLKLNVPLFRGGETLGNVKEAVTDYKEARLNYSLAYRSAELDVKKAYAYWLAAENKREAFDKAVESSARNVTLQKEDYSKSLVNNLDVLEALNSHLRTVRSANEAYYQAKKAYWDLKVSVGQILPSLADVYSA